MSQKVSSQGFEYGVKHFSNDKAGLLTEVIAETLLMSQTEVQVLLNLGAIYLNQKRQSNDTQVEVNQQIRVHTKPRRYNCTYDWKSRVVYENSDFVVLNKPNGIPSHPSVDNRIENSLEKLSQALQIQLLITHRLDTLTEGLIVYAKTAAFVKIFNHQLQNHQIEKKYCALVESETVLPTKIIHYMEPSLRAPKKVSQVAHPDWLFCELEIVEQKKHVLGSWIKINLLTGRTHQIRAQLSNLEATLVGDQLYGSKTIWKENAIALRACELQFHFAGQILQFKLDTEFDPNLK